MGKKCELCGDRLNDNTEKIIGLCDFCSIDIIDDEDLEVPGDEREKIKKFIDKNKPNENKY